MALTTAMGRIHTGGFEVEGDVERMHVEGVIGTGEGAAIVADTSLGNVTLVAR